MAGQKPSPPLPDPVSVSVSAARRFVLNATGLVAPVPSITQAVDNLGFVQIDPLNVCGRMHEHILRHRVTGYAEGDLHQHLYGIRDDAPLDHPTLPAEQRTAFEHFHPGRYVLAAFPITDWPFFQSEMSRRARSPGNWMGKLTAPEKRLATRILAEIKDRGPLGSEHIADTTRASNGWNNSRLAKVVMDKLLGQGRLLLSRRLKGRRIYDLPERIIPPEVLNLPKPTSTAVTHWTTRLKLRQHRLVTLKRNELAAIREEVQPLAFDDAGPVYCLKSDLPHLQNPPTPPAFPRLIAPLDPLIIDRPLVSRLWNFEYTWEVYTPAAKRQRGYYALPLLAGENLIGDVDLKADRSAGRLRVISRRVARGHKSTPAVTSLAQFLSLK